MSDDDGDDFIDEDDNDDDDHDDDYTDEDDADTGDRFHSGRSLAMRAMREDAESVAASRSVRRTAVVTAA